MKKNGFTLLELLIVVVVIGILATLVSGAAVYAMRTAREKRAMVSRSVLKTAISRYRSEYNRWPGGYAEGWDDAHTFSGENNQRVFSMLRVGSDDNPDGIQFFDETAFFTTATDGRNTRRLSETDPETPTPLVYQSRDGRILDSAGNYYYYKVTINYSNETVSVETPAFTANNSDEED